MFRQAFSSALSLAASAAEILSPATPERYDRDGELREVREDGWVNANTGFGTADRDKTLGSYYVANTPLTDPEIAALYNNDALAATVVDLPVKEAFRSGFCLHGLDDKEKLEACNKALKRWQVVQRATHAAKQARAFGGAYVWFRTMGDNYAMPLAEPAPKLLGLEVVDRRWLIPERYYLDGPRVGEVELYRLQVPRMGGAPQALGLIHESRLFRFPGDPVDYVERIRRRGEDQSVLQRPYEALQSAGNVWKAIEILTVDANQAIYSIKGLWRMITSDPTQGQNQANGQGRGGLLNRIRFMDLMRSVGRAIVLDKEDETFERKPTTFTGLPELSEKQWIRVSAASGIPVPLLTGEFPGGLNVTGDGPFRIFYAGIRADQEQKYEPVLLPLVSSILICEGLLTAEECTELEIKWGEMWEPTAAELADLKLKDAQASDIRINTQQISPEEAILSTPKGWYSIDRDAREQAIADADLPSVVQGEKDAAEAEAKAEALAKQPAAPGQDPNGEDAKA